MEKEIRRVKFAFGYPQGFCLDENEQKEADEMARIRNGIFHGETEQMNDELKVCMFVIEDEETGKVHYVDPQLVTFIKK